MEDSEKETIRARVDLVALVSRYADLRQAGRTYKARCPFHDERTPSFVVDPDKGRWHCFGACQTGGDVFNFLMKAESLTFPEAAERLATEAGITLTPPGGRDNEEARRRSDEKSRVFAANAVANDYFRDRLARTSHALEYANGRGLTRDTREAFSIGYAPDGWTGLVEYLAEKNVPVADAEQAGLIGASRRDGSYFDRFRARLIFPIYDVQERVVGFGGRLLAPQENAPKYLNSPESPVFSKSRTLYALNRARKPIQERDLVVVVEGYMDAVACHQAGIEFVVATLGTALTLDHIQTLGRYTRNVVLSFDADEAGERAAMRAVELFATVNSTNRATNPLPGGVAASGSANRGDFALRVLSLPRGDDPDSMLRRGDAAAFRRIIDAAITVPEFRLRAGEKRHDMQTERGRLEFLQEAVGIVAAVPSQLEQDVLLRHLAPHHPSFGSGGGRAEESLRAEVARARAQQNQRNAQQSMGFGGTILGTAPNLQAAQGRVQGASLSTPPPRRSAGREAERLLLRALLSPEWTVAVQARVLPDWFSDAPAAQLCESVLPLLRGGISPDGSIDALADTDLMIYANGLLMDDSLMVSSEAIEDCLTLLQNRQTNTELREMRAQYEQNPHPQEGTSADNDELLRRWSQKMGAMKRGDRVL